MYLQNVFLFKEVTLCQTIKFNCLALQLNLFVKTHPAGFSASMLDFKRGRI